MKSPALAPQGGQQPLPFIVVRPNGARAKMEVSAKTNFACEDCKLYFKSKSGTVDLKFVFFELH